MVSVLAFYSDNLSSNPAGYLNVLCEKTKINEKRQGLAHLKKNYPSFLLERSKLPNQKIAKSENSQIVNLLSQKFAL